MKDSRTTIFFRNDDPDTFERGDKREVLYALTDIFVGKEIPLVHAVVPNIVTEKTVLYLRKSIEDTGMIEAIQHGWQHKRYVKGEFDHSRSYEDQFADIQAGRQRMLDLFGNLFYPAFSAPYGVYTAATYETLDRLEYTVVSSAVKYGLKRRTFNSIGRALRRSVVFGKRVSYHCRRIPGTNVNEVSVAVNAMNSRGRTGLLPPEVILRRIDEIRPFTPCIGILFHHVHLSKAELSKVGMLLDMLLAHNVTFTKISVIDKQLRGPSSTWEQ